MELKNRKIKCLNYYILLGVNLFQIGFIICMCIIFKFVQVYAHITNWSFVLSSFYLFSILICDTSLYFFSSKKLEKYNHFIRNKFSSVAFPFNFMITIGFWGILLFGIIFKAPTFVEEGTEISLSRILINFHLHLGITILMLFDLFVNEKDKIKLNWFICITNTIIFIVYNTMITIAKYIFDFNAYYFMGNLNVFYLILVGIVMYGLLFGSILIYIFLVNKINKRNMIKKESGEDENLINNEGNEENCILEE